MITNPSQYEISSEAKITVRSDKVFKVNAEFTKLTGYAQSDIECIGIKSLFKDQLRSNYNFAEDISPEAGNFIIFTKSLEVREVDIIRTYSGKKNETALLIREHPNSRLESKLLYVDKLLKENIVGMGIYKIPGYILVKANPRYLGFLESPFDNAETVYGRDLSQIIPDWHTSKVKKVFDEAIQTDRSCCMAERTELLLHDNGHYWDNMLTPVSENGRVRYVISQLSDVTERMSCENQIKAQQDQLLKAEIEKRELLEDALRIKDEFLYIISHEFKTPLAVINSAIQTMELVYKDQITSKLEKYLSIIKQNTNRQLRLVNNLLDITRIDSGFTKVKRKNIDIVSLTNAIMDSVELYAMQKHIRMVFRCPVGQKNIALDDEKYERILLNLLSNAIKFTPNGRSVEVSITCVKRSKRNMVCVAVKDEGIGIPKDKQEFIFERFGQADTTLTRQAEGTGIGLYLVKQLVTVLDGIIELDSKPGQGSTFKVLLPAVTACDSEDGTDAPGALPEQNCSRLIQTAAIEFSDIYF